MVDHGHTVGNQRPQAPRRGRIPNTRTMRSTARGTRRIVTLDRFGLEVLGEPECWALLDAHHIARLAVCVANRAEIFPLNYVVDRPEQGPASLVFLTAPGTKLAGAVLGASVALEIDAADPLLHTGWSVVVHGTAAEIETMDELVRAEALPLRPWGPSDKRNYVRVSVSDLTGRRILPARAD